MNGLPDRVYAVYLGLDVGKGEHHACAVNATGARVHDKPLPQDQTRPQALYEQLATHGPMLVVVDQPASIGALPVAVARIGDAHVIAEAARTMPHTLRRVDMNEETLAGTLRSSSGSMTTWPVKSSASPTASTAYSPRSTQLSNAPWDRGCTTRPSSNCSPGSVDRPGYAPPDDGACWRSPGRGRRVPTTRSSRPSRRRWTSRALPCPAPKPLSSSSPSWLRNWRTCSTNAPRPPTRSRCSMHTLLPRS